MATQRTENRNYPYPQYDDEPFIDVMQEFAEMVDEDMGSIVITGGVAVEVWDTATPYVLNDRVIDEDTLKFYRCLIPHTSGSGTFAADRTAHPTYWENIGAVFNPTGAWAQNTAYRIMDHAYDTTQGVSAVCIADHTSTASGTIRDDVANWAFIVDLQQSISAAEQGQIILASQIFGP